MASSSSIHHHQATTSVLVPTTISSLPDPPLRSATQLAPDAHSLFLRHLIISTLHRKGFDSAEAGALAEMERLLEHHVQRLFQSAATYARYANRSQPNAADALMAQDEALAARRLKKESKRRRTAINLSTSFPPSTPIPPTTLDLLVDFASDPTEQPTQSEDQLEQSDIKPTREELHGRTSGVDGISRAGPSRLAMPVRKGPVPNYAYDWAPGIPAKFMLAGQGGQHDPAPDDHPEPVDSDPAPKVTSGSMDFVKFTTVVGENIPPELGIVHFLKAGKGGKRRRYGEDSVTVVDER